MRKLKFYSIISILVLGLLACEGNSDAGYDNAGLTEEEQADARKLIDSSLVDLKHELHKKDSITHEALKKEIRELKEEIATLKGKKK